MIRIQKSWIKEYQELSLCARDYEPHGPFACPYETEQKHMTHPE